MVTVDKNIELCRMPTIEGVKGAISALSRDSAGGPDGFTAVFYQKCWYIVGEDIFNMLLEKNLPSLISSNQSGFVKGRSIFEYIILTHEVVTDLRLKEKPTNVLIKLDRGTAYHRVS
ncbi:uncharacterized protein LOC142179977 [Nicotiana tabacum]|uniref:Uncharacterized protein LOC142179977 n=1 Tax=Nicotiana tabacum TaxID=4097 RepID=A0AC58UBX6_TOBAC